jgi:hypothetical protein
MSPLNGFRCKVCKFGIDIHLGQIIKNCTQLKPTQIFALVSFASSSPNILPLGNSVMKLFLRFGHLRNIIVLSSLMVYLKLLLLIIVNHPDHLR